MRISINWIKDYVDLSGIDIDKLAYKFTMSTAEIEEVYKMGADVKNVVAGKILTCEPVENSKKLHKLTVDVGDETVQCVCGAPNAREGIIVPFAKLGGSVVGMDKIEHVKLAGVDSYGMCCSGKEIGFSDDHSGIMELPEEVTPGTDIKEILELDDTIIEIDNKSLTNRPDLWGHYGIAREIAAITGRKLSPMPFKPLDTYKNLSAIPVEIQSDKCHRYACMSFDNITRKISPYRMQVRLFYCGMRAINFLVDLTNYIMLDIGQPMHAFDRKGIEQIVVRESRGEKFVTLDNTEREVEKGDLFICNNDTPIALAGVMGGLDSEVTDETKSIILESANFDAATIRKTAAKLGMRTEASARYEKTLDSEYVPQALARFVHLLTKYDSGATVSSSVTDEIKVPQESVTIRITREYIDKYIGQQIPLDRIIEILTSLKFEVNMLGNELIIDVPTYRASKDISIKADIVEEISRIYGFDNITPKPTDVELKVLDVNTLRDTEHKVKEFLAYEAGLSETHSYIWYDNKFNKEVGIGELPGMKLVSPSAPECSNIREYMAPTQIKFAEENRKNFDEFGLFEIGSVATFKNDDVEEHKELGVLIASKKVSESEMFFKLKGIINKMFDVIKNVSLNYVENTDIKYTWVHPVKSAKLMYGDVELGYMTVLHPKVKGNIDKKLNIALCEINMFKVNEIAKKIEKFVEPSKYPEINYDLSLLVKNEVKFETLMNDIKGFISPIMIGTRLVEIYTGNGLPEGMRSITLNFKWGSNDHTLTSEEVDSGKAELLKYLNSKGYESRY